MNHNSISTSNIRTENMLNSGIIVKPRLCQPKIKSFMDKVSDKEKAKIDEALAKLFFGCNVDSKVDDSDYFRNFIKILRPGYVPPTSQEISTTLLNKCYENFENRKKNFNNAPGILYILLVKQNGSKCVLTFIRHMNFEISFLRSSLMTSATDYESELSENVLTSLELAKNVYHLNVYAIVSKVSSICIYTNFNVRFSMCNVEVAHIIANSILDDVSYQKADLILTEYKQNGDLQNILKLDKEENMEQSSYTWMAHFKAYLFYLKHADKLKELLIVSKFKLPQEITLLLFDNSFEVKVSDRFNTLKSIFQLIEKFEKMDCCIGEAIEEWKDLYTSTSDVNLKKRLCDLQKDVMNPLGLTANFLHHKYSGQNLTNEELQEVHEFLLDNLNEEGLNQLILYKERKGKFSKIFEKNISSPQTFWSLAETDYPDLAQISKKIISIPASAIDLKCHFIKGRYSSNEELKKHVNLYYELKYCDSIQTDRF